MKDLVIPIRLHYAVARTLTSPAILTIWVKSVQVGGVGGGKGIILVTTEHTDTTLRIHRKHLYPPVLTDRAVAIVGESTSLKAPKILADHSNRLDLSVHIYSSFALLWRLECELLYHYQLQCASSQRSRVIFAQIPIGKSRCAFYPFCPGDLPLLPLTKGPHYAAFSASLTQLTPPITQGKQYSQLNPAPPPYPISQTALPPAIIPIPTISYPITSNSIPSPPNNEASFSQNCCPLLLLYAVVCIMVIQPQRPRSRHAFP